MKEKDKKTATAPTAEPSADSLFKLHLDGKNILFTLLPLEEGLEKPTVEFVAETCRKRGYRDVNLDVIRTCLETDSKTAVTIGIYEPRKATATIALSADNMQAWMKLSPPDPGGSALGEDEVRALIRIEGIIFGVDDRAVMSLAKDPVYEEDVLIAQGRPVEDGADADFVYHFETEKKSKAGRLDEEGKVDHKELNLIENVVVGQLLATKVPPTQGVPGVTVKNEYIAPKPGRDKLFAPGKNVELTPNGLEAHATANGAAMIVAGKVTVSQIYQIHGSVGPETGNINFLGTVQITDSIEDGFSVKATDAVMVGKTVGKSVVEAGGDVTVRGGVIEAKVISGGDLRAKFVEASTLDARNDIIVNEAVMHSNVESGGRVIVGLGGRKGTIVGGQIRAYKLIACKVLGSPMSTKTDIHAGINPKLLSRMEELQAAIIKDRGNFDNLKKGMQALTLLKEKLGSLPDDKQKIFDTLLVAQESLKTRLQEFAGELRDLQAQASVKVKASVSVSDDVYPGVKISIGHAVLYTTQEEKFVTFKEESGEIRHHTYEAPKMKKPAKGEASDDD